MKIEPPQSAPNSRRARRSIAARMAWLNLGATAVLLLAAEAFLHWGLERTLQTLSERLLATKVDIVRLLLGDPANTAALESEIEHEAGSGHAAKYYIRIVGPDGRTLLETSRMSEALPVNIFPAPALRTDSAAPLAIYRASSGDEFTLLTARAATGGPRPELRTLHIAQDISVHRAIIATVRRWMVAVFIVGVALAAVAGVLVARASLRPVREIARTAQHITASHLDARLNPERWPEELRVCAAAFDAMLDRLQTSFNRLSEFSAEIAHALRNPINNLRGEAEVALQQARSPEEYTQTLGSSLEELERLSRLIDGLLFIARADDPRAALDRVSFSARREIDAVRDFYDALAADRKIEVICRGDAAIRGDPALVRRAISNLLGNAIKHTKPGGNVILEARQLEDGTAEIRAADNGCGIRAEYLDRIFERFFQVDRTLATNGNGVGLGLAIVRSIMRLHGGTASVSSIVDHGTTVTLRFPPSLPPEDPRRS